MQSVIPALHKASLPCSSEGGCILAMCWTSELSFRRFGEASPHSWEKGELVLWQRVSLVTFTHPAQKEQSYPLSPVGTRAPWSAGPRGDQLAHEETTGTAFAHCHCWRAPQTLPTQPG